LLFVEGQLSVIPGHWWLDAIVSCFRSVTCYIGF